MNRREFLKAGVAAIAAMSLPAMPQAGEKTPFVIGVDPAMPGTDTTVIMPLDNHWADFDPAGRYGNQLPLTYDPGPHLRQQLVSVLYRDMVKWVPPPYRDLVKIVRPYKSDYMRRDGIAWLYEPPGGAA